MVEVSHDWDDEDCTATLRDAYQRYRRACYGDRALPPEQVRETFQAFLSGVHWLNSRDDYDPVAMQEGLRELLLPKLDQPKGDTRNE